MIEASMPLYGVEVIPLRQIPDERGAVMHMMRVDSSHFVRFGEVYFSQVKRGAVKAWKRHLQMTQNFAVPVGAVLFALYDDRPESPTRGKTATIELGPDRYGLLRIPPLIWYGFAGVASTDSLIVNCADLPHDPAESERRDQNDSTIPYIWRI